MSILVGDAVTFTYLLTVDDVPTDATVVLTLTAPDGTTSAPTVTTGTVGTYEAVSVVDQAGTWAYSWEASGDATDVDSGLFDVVTSQVVSIAEVRARLNKTSTVDDVELSAMIDAAVAEYVEWVGPVESKTLRYDGGGQRLILPMNVTRVTAVAYSDGEVIDLDDLDFDADTGLLGWNYGSSGSGVFNYGGGAYFAAGHRNVLVTMTVRLPANHREAIIADVAGYFAATQRGGGQGPSFSSEGYELPFQSTPQTLFPRIRAIAASYPSVA